MIQAALSGGVTALLLLAIPVHAAAKNPVKPKLVLSAFQQEEALSPAELIKRWHPITTKASKRFGVPLIWINAVMRLESGGRNMLSENQKMISDKGALGLMQVLPGTYAEMRAQYGLGADVFDPKNNIHAGTAYLKWLRGKYGFPAMFAAYNAGPGSVEAVMGHTKVLPAETRLYMADINKILDGGADGMLINSARLTRPDGTMVLIDPIAVNSIRAVAPSEYAEGVQTVIVAGRLRQGVKEGLQTVAEAIRIRGGTI